jgi:mono/diheme cytochrome c family protein
MEEHMKRIIWGVGIILTAATAITAAACQGAAAKAARADVARIERGNYLVSSIGCSDCHTPKRLGPNGPEVDTARLLAGHSEGTELPARPAGNGPWAGAVTWDLTAWSGPWGISFAANLTPD